MTDETQTNEPAGMLTRFPPRLSWLPLALLLAALGLQPASALDNVYTNTVSGKWESPTNWSQAAPFLDNSIYITNAGTKTVTVDSNTVSFAPGTLAVTNLTLSGPSNTINT